MFRKHFRFKRTVLGLAFATMIVPVAPAGAVSLSTFVDGGPAPVSNTTITSYQPSYLRYHEVGVPVATGPKIRAEHSVTAPTITPLQAERRRWTAMAQRYEQLRPTVAISERSNGVHVSNDSAAPEIASLTPNGFLST